MVTNRECPESCKTCEFERDCDSYFSYCPYNAKIAIVRREKEGVGNFVDRSKEFEKEIRQIGKRIENS